MIYKYWVIKKKRKEGRREGRKKERRKREKERERKKKGKKETQLSALDIRAVKWCWFAHNALF